jgi:hypothetical protein
LRLRRGLDPAAVAGSVTEAVIRIDASFHRLWSRRDARELAEEVTQALSSLVGELRELPQSIAAIQLDYDSPVRCLGSYAEFVHRLKASLFRGFPLWITSLPAHMETEDYARLFGGGAEGHILQLFDTGLPLSEHNLDRIFNRLAHHELPAMLGFGTFERRTNRGATHHLGWLVAAARPARAIAHLRGLWLFPAGQRYLQHGAVLEEWIRQ